MIRFAWVPVAVRLIGLLVAGMSIAGCVNAIATGITFPMVNNAGFLANSWRMWPMTGSFVGLGFGLYLLLSGRWIASLVLRGIEAGWVLPAVRLVGLVIVGLSMGGCANFVIRGAKVDWSGTHSTWLKLLDPLTASGAVVAFAVGGSLLLGGRGIGRWLARGVTERCPRCGFDIRGTPGGECTECGFGLRESAVGGIEQTGEAGPRIDVRAPRDIAGPGGLV
ncbi:MAG: hypothetical protein H7Y88_11265 [Phycisphaerales bacterium]|nr:hypothetical protein [Phycisphaerales bacterium]